jgi:glycosyltransferase involved in cell wall biosynthesis
MQFVQEWKDVFCYVLLHEEAVIPDEFHYPNVEYVKSGKWYPYTPNQVMVSDELYSLFNPIDGKYQVDAAITTKTVLAPSLKRLLMYDSKLAVPVIVLEPWVSAGLSSSPSIDTRLRALAYAECPTFFLTSREKQLALDFSKDFLSSSALSDMHSNSTVRSQGLPAKRVRDHERSVEKFDTFTFVFSARFNANKQWDKVLEVYEDIFRMGRDVQIKAVGTTSMPSNISKRFSKVEFIPSQSYEDYVDLISRSHVAVSMSIDEGFSCGWSENICTGNPVLLPKKSWSSCLVGDADYPFFYRSPVELIALLKWIYDNYEESRDKMRKYADYFVDHHDISVAAEGVINRISDAVDGTWRAFEKWDKKFTVALGEMPEEFTFSEFIEYCEKKYKAKFGLFTPAYIATIGAYRNIYVWLCHKAKDLYSADMKFRRV